MDFVPNGFLVRGRRDIDKHLNRVYTGVEGNPWPLLDIPNPSGSTRELFEYIESYVLHYGELDSIDVCDDAEITGRICEECKNAGIDFCLLYCETPRKKPRLPIAYVEKIKVSSIFLGFDYADSSFDYYSCVFSDVFSERIDFGCSFDLNEYGLFDEYDKALDFVQRRNELAQLHPELFEKGDFIVYKLWLVL